MSRDEEPEDDVPTISVSASATLDAVPDEARLHVNLTADGRSSNSALEAVAKRLEAIDAICDRHDVGASDRSSTVSVNEQRERDGGRWLSKGYQATATLQLTVRDADQVGPLVSAVVEEAGPALRGPFWQVSPDHPGHLEVCSKAGAQARGKAEAYAAAVGVELGPLLALREPGVSSGPMRRASRSSAPPAPAAMSAMSAETDDAPAAPVIDLHPGTQQLRTHIEVVFAIEQD